MIPSTSNAVQANFGAQDTGVLKEFGIILFNTAIIQWFQGAIIIFFCIALVASLVMENFFPELANDYTFSSRFQQVSLLVGFIYFIWVNRNMTGSVDPIRGYRSFLDLVKGIAVVLSAVVTQDPAAKEHKEALLRYMIFLIDEMVRPGGSLLDPDNFKLPPDFAQRINLLGERANVFRRFDLAVHCLIEAIPPGPEAALVATKIQALTEHADTLERGQLIREPIVFEVSIVLFLVFWWLVYTPASMWVQFGTIHTLWAYPLVLVVIAAPGIFRMWVGSPWNPMRPLRIAEHRHWPREYVELIGVLFQAREKRAEELLTNFGGPKTRL